MAKQYDLGRVVGEAPIDDAAPSSTKVYSSQKTQYELDQLSQQMGDVVAEEWDAAKTYQVGAFVMWNGILWRCEVGTASEEPQSGSSCWKQVRISDEVLFKDLPVYTDTSIFTNGSTMAYCVGDIVVVNVNVNFLLNSTPTNSMLVSGLPISKRAAYAALCLSDGSAVRMRIHENKDCVTTDGVVNVKGWSNGQIVYIKK